MTATTVEYGTRRTVIVVGVMLSSLLGRVDGTIVNVSLPTIQGNLGATFDEVAWTITGYLMANVVVIPLTPWLAARFGRRRAFIGAIVGFTVMSFLCATASTIAILVAFRILQGMFAGGIDAAANSVLSSTFPPEKLTVAQSIFSLSAAFAPPIGLVLGGILTDDLSWQWCFLINVPLGVAAVVVLTAMLRNPAPTGAATPKIDVPGVSLLAVGPSLLIYFLSEGDRYDWLQDGNLVASLVGGFAATAAFVLWELRGTRKPIVDLRIFKYRSVAVGAAVFVANAIVYLSSMIFLPQYAQEVLGFTPTQSGVLILARSLPTTLCVPIAGWLAAGRVQPRYLIVAGFLIMALGTFWLSLCLTAGSDAHALVAPLAVAGVGNALTFSPLFVAIIGGVPHAERPKAAAITSVTIQLGGAIATASLVTALHVRSAAHQSVIAANITSAHPVVNAFIHAYGLARLASLVAAQASDFAFTDVAFLLAATSVLGAVLACGLGRLRAERRTAGPGPS